MNKLPVKAKLRGGYINCRDLFVGECQLFVIQMYSDKKGLCPDIFTRIGSWKNVSSLMTFHSIERKMKNGGYIKLIHHDDIIPGYESKILEVKENTNAKLYNFYIDIFPAFCM